MTLKFICKNFLILFILSTLSAAEAHRRMFPRTLVVSQSQFYPLREISSGYLGRWTDQPLLLEPDLSSEGITEAGISRSDFFRQQQIGQRCGIDGFAFFPESFRRMGLFDYAEQSKTSFLQIPIVCLWLANENRSRESVRRALAGKGSYRHNNKVLLLSYWTDKHFTPEQLDQRLKKLRAEFGDTFYFIPDIQRLAWYVYQNKFRTGTQLTEAETKELQERLRSYLRVSDGLYFGETHMLHHVSDMTRIFNTAYYREFVIRNMLTILNEPEFRGKKLLALSAINGHENSYAIGYQMSHNGTKTFRNSLETAIAANPDVINLPEWDEYNENTCIGPTLYNSFSTKRMLHYYMAGIQRGKVTPLPGDDTTVPNLVLSYRKTLSLGEKLQIEVLQIPDGAWKNPLECSIELRDINGKMLKEFAPETLAPDRIADVTFSIPAHIFAGERLLQLVLSVRSGGKTYRYDRGFAPIELRTGANWDMKYVKQPLRDLLEIKKLEISRTGSTFHVDLEAGEELRSIGLNLNGDIVYLHDPSGKYTRFRKNDQYAVFAISTLQWNSRIFDNSFLKVSGAPEAEFLHEESVTAGPVFPFRWISVYARPIYLRILRANVPKATLQIDIKGICTEAIDLASVLREGVYAHCGPKGLQITVASFQRQARYPNVLRGKAYRFDATIPDDIASKVVFLQAVGMSGKTYRSKPFVVEESSAPVPVKLYCASSNQVVNVSVPAVRVPRLEYDFSPASGGCLKTKNRDRTFFGMLGSPYSPAVQRNRGPSTLGDPLYAAMQYRKETVSSVPGQVKTEGKYALDFDGRGHYAALPQNAIPTWSEFTVYMDVLPRNLTKKQLLIATRSNNTPGSLWGIFILPGGSVSAEYAGLNYNHTSFDSQLKLKVNEWNKITLRWVIDSMTLEINGTAVSRRSVAPGRYSCPTIIGGVPGMFFDGMIRDLVIDHTGAPRP